MSFDVFGTLLIEHRLIEGRRKVGVRPYMYSFSNASAKTSAFSSAVVASEPSAFFILAGAARRDGASPARSFFTLSHPRLLRIRRVALAPLHASSILNLSWVGFNEKQSGTPAHAIFLFKLGTRGIIAIQAILRGF